MIRSWIGQDECLWADLEEKLGHEIIKVNEKTLSAFYKDKSRELAGLYMLIRAMLDNTINHRLFKFEENTYYY